MKKATETNVTNKTNDEKNNSGVTIYDKRKIYEKDIAPLIVEAMKKCVVNDIPFMFQCAVQNTEKKTVYDGDMYLTGSAGITLTNDRFERHLAVMNGFETHWPGMSIPFNEAEAAYNGQLSDFELPRSYQELYSEVE